MRLRRSRLTRMTGDAKPVGVLFIVLGAGAPPQKAAAYTTQVIASARTARLSNPQLPIGLIFDSLTRRELAPEALLGSIFTDLRTVKFNGTRALGSFWLKRLQGAPPLFRPSIHRIAHNVVLHTCPSPAF